MGRKIIPKRYSSKLEKIHNWINHRNYAIVFSFILLYSIFAPLPSNLFMIFLGIDKLPYKKMIFPVWIGNIIFGVGIAIIGFYGLGALFVWDYFINPNLVDIPKKKLVNMCPKGKILIFTLLLYFLTFLAICMPNFEGIIESNNPSQISVLFGKFFTL